MTCSTAHSTQHTVVLLCTFQREWVTMLHWLLLTCSSPKNFAWHDAWEDFTPHLVNLPSLRRSNAFTQKFFLTPIVHSIRYLHTLIAPYSFCCYMYMARYFLDMDSYANIWLMLVFHMGFNVLESQDRVCFAQRCIPSVWQILSVK